MALVAALKVLLTCNRSSCQKLQRSHFALLVGEAGLEMCIRGKIDSGEGDVSQETRLSTLHTQVRSPVESLQGGREGKIILWTHYLIKPEESEVTDHTERADARASGDLSCHLQADLHNLQRVGKDDLRASSLVKNKYFCFYPRNHLQTNQAAKCNESSLHSRQPEPQLERRFHCLSW